MQSSHEQFRSLAWQNGLAATHQRRIIYDAIVAAPGHYSPEAVYDEVRKQIPAISLATVYKNIRLFVDHGLLREVSPHPSTLRVDGNLEPHHHLVCIRCKSVTDIDGDFIDFARLGRQLPDGFDVANPLVEVFGLCQNCKREPQS